MNLDYLNENNLGLSTGVKAKQFDSRVITNDQLLYQSSSTNFVNAYNPISPMTNRKKAVKDQNKTSQECTEVGDAEEYLKEEETPT